MFYGRMWLVVKPSVGIPMGAVGIMGTSLFVHACILTNTTWFPAFLNGSAKPRVVSEQVDPGGVKPGLQALAMVDLPK
jgi:light-harvesting protein B-800-850 alpha chain